MKTHRHFAPFTVLAVAATVMGQQTPVVYNLPSQVQDLMSNLESNQSGRFLAVGDSIVFTPPWSSHFQSEFNQEYGPGGYGYRGGNRDLRWGTQVKILFSGHSPNIVQSTSNGKRNPTWGIYTPDGIYTRLRGDGAATVTMLAGNSVFFHYLQFPGGGDIAVDKSGVRVLTVPTDGAVGDVRVALPPGTKYRIYSTDDRWVQFDGMEIVRSSNDGFVFNRLARGGDGPRDYITANTESTLGVYQALDGDLLWIDFDWVAAKEFKTYYQDVNTYLDFVQPACPNIILCTHHLISNQANIGKQPAILYQIAQERSLGFVNHQFISHQEMVDAGYLMPDGIHFTNAGGAFFAHHDAELIRFAFHCKADWNEDGVLDVNDLIAFNEGWSAGDADWDGNGITDDADLAGYQAAYDAGCQ